MSKDPMSTGIVFLGGISTGILLTGVASVYLVRKGFKAYTNSPYNSNNKNLLATVTDLTTKQAEKEGSDGTKTTPGSSPPGAP
jgi:hypothetical protein